MDILFRREDFQIVAELQDIHSKLQSTIPDEANDARADLKKKYHQAGWDVLAFHPEKKYVLLSVARKTLLRSILRLDIPSQPFHTYSKAHQLLIVQHAIDEFLLKQSNLLHIQNAWLAHQEDFCNRISVEKNSHQRSQFIYQYYGAEAAFYFAWLDFYTLSLLPLAVLGALVWLQQWMGDSLDSTSVPAFAVLLTLWTVAVLALWKHRAAELNIQWGLHMMYNPSEDEELLSQHAQKTKMTHPTVNNNQQKSTSSASTVSATQKPLDSSSLVATLLRKVLSLAGTLAVCLALLQVALFSLNLYFDLPKQYNSKNTIVDISEVETWPWQQWCVCALYSLIPVIAPMVFEPLLNMFTAFEAHETTILARQALVQKRFLLHFVNRHVALLYLVFVRRDLCALRDLLVSLLVVGQVRSYCQFHVPFK